MNKTQRADKSQKLVVSLLRDKGFKISQVKNPSANGLDIVAVKNNKHFLIEVKSASYSERSWRVTKPHPQSDYIAVVMPNDYIHFDYVRDWMALCAKDGSRRITPLVNLYEEL